MDNKVLNVDLSIMRNLDNLPYLTDDGVKLTTEKAYISFLLRQHGAEIINFDHHILHNLGFLDMNMRGWSFAGCALEGVKFINCDLEGADLSSTRGNGVYFAECNLRGVNFHNTTLKNSNMRGSDLSGVEINVNSSIRRKFIMDGFSTGANMGHIPGIQNPYDWLVKNFRRADDGLHKGFIVYKVTYKSPIKQKVRHFPMPDGWEFSRGSEIRAIPNPDISQDCGCGVNFGTASFVYVDIYGLDGEFDIWRCLLDEEGLATLVVPLGTNGKARTGKLKLLETITIHELRDLQMEEINELRGKDA